jgi:hypothetical protein
LERRRGGKNTRINGSEKRSKIVRITNNIKEHEKEELINNGNKECWQERKWLIGNLFNGSFFFKYVIRTNKMHTFFH